MFETLPYCLMRRSLFRTSWQHFQQHNSELFFLDTTQTSLCNSTHSTTFLHSLRRSNHLVTDSGTSCNHQLPRRDSSDQQLAMSTITTAASVYSDKHERDQYALSEVQQFEGSGRVINDCYTKEEYIRRRHGSLAKHPEHRNLSSLGQSAEWDAETVFYLENSNRLSVQEVRRRELQYEIVPLLQFPTSSNMHTLDNFAGYPIHEWQPGDEIPGPYKILNPLALQPASPQMYANNLIAASDAEAQYPPTRSVSDMSGQTATQSQHFNGEAEQIGSFVTQQTDTAGMHPSSQLNNSHTSTSAQILPANMDKIINYPPLANRPTDPSSVTKFCYDLAQCGSLGPQDAPEEFRRYWNQAPPQAAPAPPQQTAASARETKSPNRFTTASSLSRSPVESRVKLPANGKKRAAPDDMTELDAVAPRDDSAQPDAASEQHAGAANQLEAPARPAKKVKLTSEQASPATDDEPQIIRTNAPRKRPTPATDDEPQNTRPAKAPRKTTAPSTAESDTSPQVSSRPARKTVPTAKAAANSTNDSISPSPSNNKSTSQRSTVVERVASGDILPTSREIALQARVHRHERLRADHSRKNKKKRHPDFAPEFFERQNFDKELAGSGNVVRCICGDTNEENTNHGEKWVGCDNPQCEVWQHQSCVGEALGNVDNEYLCHMCDPFRHRKELQKIRKAAGALP